MPQSLAKNRADALLVPSTLFLGRRVQIVTLAAARAMPTMYYAREFTKPAAF